MILFLVLVKTQYNIQHCKENAFKPVSARVILKILGVYLYTLITVTNIAIGNVYYTLILQIE